MFINCKHCNALVATDPATDLPPDRCPRCAGALRQPAGAAADPAPVETAAAAVAMPTISSLLMPAAAPDRLAMPPGPSAATGDAMDAVGEATAVTEVPATPAADEAAPGDTAPVDAGADAPIVTAEAAAEDIRATAPVDATPAEDVADGIPVPDAPDAPDAPDVSDAPDASGVEATADDPPQAEPALPAIEPGIAPPPAPGDAPRQAADTSTAPSFLPARPRTARATPARRWLLPTAIAALALLLGLQVLLADRARLAADAQWRPLVVSLCKVFGCEVPAWHEPAAFTLLAREVRPHPQAAGALRVDATFRNDARWPQPWPRLLLTLSDIEGRPVAARAFDPADYLAEPAATSTLDSGATAHIRIDVREPAAATVSYSFDFR